MAGELVTQDIDAIGRKLAVLESRLLTRAAPDPDDELHHIVDCIADPAFVLADGRIVFANAAAANSHGVDHRDRLIGAPQGSIYHPGDHDSLEAQIDEAHKPGGSVVFGAIRGVTRSGETFRETLRITAISWNARPAVLVICRKYASTEAPPAALVPDDLAPPALEGVNSGVWEWNPNTDRVYLGPRLKDVLRFAPSTRGRAASKWQDVVKASDLETVRQALAAHVADETSIVDVEAQLCCGDGDHQWMRLTGKALRDQNGSVARVAGTASDISRLKVTEEKLKARTNQVKQLKALLDSRGTRTLELEGALRAARQDVQLGEHRSADVLANMSHELRTPLNAITGFAEVIRDEMFGPVGTLRYRDYADDILSSATRLTETVDNILDLSNLQAGKVELCEDDLDLRRLPVSVIRLVRDRADEAGVALTLGTAQNLPRLRADARMVKQMLLHLLSNAIKFTPPGGTIKVAAFAGNDGGARIVVHDTGQGMAEDAIEIALRPFGKGGDPMVQANSGLGFGLPIVRSQIELHGGRLEIESGSDTGTKATLRFPPERSLTS